MNKHLIIIGILLQLSSILNAGSPSLVSREIIYFSKNKQTANNPIIRFDYDSSPASVLANAYNRQLNNSVKNCLGYLYHKTSKKKNNKITKKKTEKFFIGLLNTIVECSSKIDHYQSELTEVLTHSSSIDSIADQTVTFTGEIFLEITEKIYSLGNRLKDSGLNYGLTSEFMKAQGMDLIANKIYSLISSSFKESSTNVSKHMYVDICMKVNSRPILFPSKKGTEQCDTLEALAAVVKKKIVKKFYDEYCQE